MKPQQFVVIGLGRFGSSLALELMSMGYEVLGIDHQEERVEEMTGRLTHAVMADATDEGIMRSLGCVISTAALWRSAIIWSGVFWPRFC